MNESIVIGLIRNIAILLTFSMLYDLFWVRIENSKIIYFKIAAGLVLGGIGIVLFLTPWTFTPGIFFDTRSIMLSVSGLFFGPVPTLIAMLIVGLYRLFLGGPGVWMGIAVVFTSGVSGLLWRHFRPFWRNKNNVLELAGLGLLVHFIMLFCTTFLPEAIRMQTLENIFFPVLFLYPVATVLLGMQMLGQYRNRMNKKALDISEERWHFALEGTGDGVWDRNLKTNEIYFSKQWKAMLGYAEDEIENKYEQWENRVHPEDLTEVKLLINKAISGEIPVYEAEYRFLFKDGSYKWILSRGKIMSRDEKGIPLRFIGTHKDITERKEKELLLAHERYLLDALMNYSPESIYFKDLESRFIRVNNASAHNFGFDDATMVIGKSDFDFFTAEYATKTFNEEQEIIQKGRSFSGEEKGNWIDGSETWGLSNKMPLHNPVGEIIGTFGITVNITERKQAEQALKESEQYTNSILSVIPDLIFVLNAEGVYLDFKSGNIEDLAAPKEMFINKSVFEVLPESIAMQIKAGIDSVLKNKMANSIEYELPVNSGIGVFECFILPFGDTKVIAMIRNITRRKQVEEALRSSQEQLKNFAAHLQDVREEERVLLAREIHDELGQILIALKIDLGMLKQNVIKNTESSSKDDIINNFNQVSNLLDNTIKTTRKIMTGLRPEVLEMVGFTEAARLYALEFEDRYHVKCVFKSTISDLKINSQQSVALFRILQEALSNVVKHAKATTAKVNLSFKDDKIIMKITDNGIGLDGNLKIKHDSYGLIGMRERVFLLDGELTISGQLDEGTCVLVEMPYSC